MSTEKSPEQIAEERYPHPDGPFNSSFVDRELVRTGYAACYREHVLNRPPVTLSEEEIINAIRKAPMIVVPPVTEEGIMEVVDILVKIKANIDHGVEQANILFNMMGRRLNGRDHEDGDVLKNDNAEMDMAIKKLNDMVSYLTPNTKP